MDKVVSTAQHRAKAIESSAATVPQNAFNTLSPKGTNGVLNYRSFDD